MLPRLALAGAEGRRAQKKLGKFSVRPNVTKIPHSYQIDQLGSTQKPSPSAEILHTALYTTN